LEYLPTVVGGKPICITTDWTTSAFFDPNKYFYVDIKGTHNRLYYCLSWAIFRTVDKHTYLEKLFTDYFACDVTIWTLKPKRDYELNLYQMVSKFVISEHLEKLDPPPICPIEDDWKSWGVLREFVMSKADKIYFTQAVDNTIKQLYHRIHNSNINPITQQDDIVVIYVMTLLFNIGIRVWHNASVDGEELVVKPIEYAQRCNEQSFNISNSVQFFPIVNLLFIPAGTFWQGNLQNTSKWSILLEYDSIYTQLYRPYPYSISCPNPDYTEYTSHINPTPTPQLDYADRTTMRCANQMYHGAYSGVQHYFASNNIDASIQRNWYNYHHRLLIKTRREVEDLATGYKEGRNCYIVYERRIAKYQNSLQTYNTLTPHQKRNPRNKAPRPPVPPDFPMPLISDLHEMQARKIMEFADALYGGVYTPNAGPPVLVDLTEDSP
jgi:hypothetical protein